jgi:ASC-1-like (ASCH) protein
MPEFHLPVRPDRLAQIREGAKDLDIRVGNDKNVRRIRPDDRITFRAGDDSIRTKVVAVRTYSSFEKMLNSEKFNRIAPEMIGEGQLLMALCDYYPHHEEATGVYVFEIQREV